MTRFAVLLASAALLLTTGCASMAPTYVRPPAPVPASFPSGGAYPAQAPGPSPQTDWRAFITDPKLRALIELALKQNRDLRGAVQNIRVARQELHVQAAAELPTISGSAAALYEHTPTEVALGSVGTVFQGVTLPKDGIDFHDFTAGIGISDYELDLWGRVRSLTKEALEQYRSTVEAKRETEITLVSEVATDAVTYAADLERLKVAKETLDSDQKTYDLTVARFKDGISSELDVRQAQGALEQARYTVAAYTAQGAQDLNALTLVVGAPIDPGLLPSPDAPELPALAEAPRGLSSTVLLSRPDVLEAEHLLKAQNADIGAARAAFFPAVTLTANGGGAAVGLSRLFNAANGSWLFQPNISLPIFTGGANLARLREAKAQKEVAIAQYEKAVQTAFREVADALAQRGVIDAELEAQQRSVEAATKSLELSQARYRRGSDPFLNTLTAEVTLASARQNLISARLIQATNLVTLYRVFGGGADAR